MAEVTYKITIDGVEWQACHIERIEYERNLYILHQMKRHGIEIMDGDKILSDDDIDFLTKEKAWEVSIATRAKYPGSSVAEFYQESFEKSDAMWKQLGFSLDKPMKVSHCNMDVTGISLDDYMEMIMDIQSDIENSLAAHPEHFNTVEDGKTDKIYGIEAFGMYGTPTMCQVMFATLDDVGTQIQADNDPDYPVDLVGRAFLRDGVTAVNVPYHQFKDTGDGFSVKMAVYWPEGVPDDLVSGHSLHLALEFYEGIKLATK